DALGRAASLADGSRVHADDLSVLADEHGFRLFVHQHDAAHPAVARRGLHVDHAFAAARLQAVFVNIGAFAVALLGHAQDERRFLLAIFAVLALGALF